MRNLGMAVGALALAACGDNVSPPILAIYGEPTFVAYRATGAWIVPSGDQGADGYWRYRLDEVADDYVAAFACSSAVVPGQVVVHQLDATIGDGDQTFDGLCVPPDLGAATLDVTAYSAQSVDLTVGGTPMQLVETGATPEPYKYEAQVAPGPRDLIAVGGVDGENRSEIHRALDVVDGPITDKQFDLSTDGAPLALDIIAFTGDHAGTAQARSSIWTTANGFVGVSNGIVPSTDTAEPVAIPVPDPSQLESADVLDLEVDLEFASVYVEVTASASPPTSIELPPHISVAPNVGTDGTVTWTAPDGAAFDDASFALYTTDNSVAQSLDVTSAYLAAHPDEPTAFDATAPGWNPAWNAYAQDFTLFMRLSSMTITSDYTLWLDNQYLSSQPQLRDALTAP